jgi:hypothetical protein
MLQLGFLAVTEGSCHFLQQIGQQNGFQDEFHGGLLVKTSECMNILRVCKGTSYR